MQNNGELKTYLNDWARNENKSAFQSSNRRTKSLHKLKYNTGELVNTYCEIFSLVSNYCQIQTCNGDALRCTKTNSDSCRLTVYIWMFLLECCWLSDVNFLNGHWFSNWSCSAQDVWYIVQLLFFRKWTKTRRGGGGTRGVLSRSHDSKFSISRITKQKIH